jgi:hypothetical protein
LLSADFLECKKSADFNNVNNQLTLKMSTISLLWKMSTIIDNSQRIPQRIPKEFPKDSQKNPKEFLKNIPKEFSKNSK